MPIKWKCPNKCTAFLENYELSRVTLKGKQYFIDEYHEKILMSRHLYTKKIL